MRDAQNVDTARAPRFRFGILRVDDRAQDAESSAKKKWGKKRASLDERTSDESELVRERGGGGG